MQNSSSTPSPSRWQSFLLRSCVWGAYLFILLNIISAIFLGFSFFHTQLLLHGVVLSFPAFVSLSALLALSAPIYVFPVLKAVLLSVRRSIVDKLLKQDHAILLGIAALVLVTMGVVSSPFFNMLLISFNALGLTATNTWTVALFLSGSLTLAVGASVLGLACLCNAVDSQKLHKSYGQVDILLTRAFPTGCSSLAIFFMMHTLVPWGSTFLFYLPMLVLSLIGYVTCFVFPTALVIMSHRVDEQVSRAFTWINVLGKYLFPAFIAVSIFLALQFYCFGLVGGFIAHNFWSFAGSSISLLMTYGTYSGMQKYYSNSRLLDVVLRLDEQSGSVPLVQSNGQPVLKGNEQQQDVTIPGFEQSLERVLSDWLTPGSTK